MNFIYLSVAIVGVVILVAWAAASAARKRDVTKREQEVLNSDVLIQGDFVQNELTQGPTPDPIGDPAPERREALENIITDDMVGFDFLENRYRSESSDLDSGSE